MPQDPAAALSSLLRASSIQDHEEVLRAANAAIKANRNDAASQRVRVVALVKLDRFDDALRALDEGGLGLNTACLLEKAYALYKTGKIDDANATLRSAGLGHRGVTHVAAQVAYRSERFDEARAIYQRLLDDDPGDEENDLGINVKATEAQLEWQGWSPSVPSSAQDHDAFELCYNAACASIARGAFDDAANLLQRASRLCDASDELSEEDKQSEMRPILAQQAYVYAKLGKIKEALDLYQSLGATGTGEPDFTIISENNRAAVGNDGDNPFLLQRRVASWAHSQRDAKLFRYQADLLSLNNLIVDLKAQKVRGVQDRTAKMLSQAQHPSLKTEVNTISSLNAAAETLGLDGKEIIRSMHELSSKRPYDVGIILTIIQLQLQQGKGAAALSVLESFLDRLDHSEEIEAKEVRFSPGVLALAVSLMRAQGREASAKTELVKAASYWRETPGISAAPLLREAGIELLRSSNDRDLDLAGSAFKRLLDEDRGSHITSAGLVASLAPTNPSEIQQHVAGLPPVEALIEGVDVGSLIEAGVTVAPRSIPATSKKRPAPDETGDNATKKRRKRKLPKSYEEGKLPDPERWLPLRDRSSYRPKGKKGKKKIAESTQGGVVKEEETLGLVGGGGVKVEKAPPSGPSKKKKKGKK